MVGEAVRRACPASCEPPPVSFHSASFFIANVARFLGPIIVVRASSPWKKGCLYRRSLIRAVLTGTAEVIFTGNASTLPNVIRSFAISREFITPFVNFELAKSLSTPLDTLTLETTMLFHTIAETQRGSDDSHITSKAPRSKMQCFTPRQPEFQSVRTIPNFASDFRSVLVSDTGDRAQRLYPRNS